jgi:hypothetical protein
MKRYFSYAVLLVLLSVPAFAGSNSQSISIPSAVTVGSVQLPAGDYKVNWTGAGPDVQVTLTRNGKSVVTTSAKVVAERNTYIGVGTQAQGSVNVLQTIQLSNVSLVLEAPAAVATVSSGH